MDKYEQRKKILEGLNYGDVISYKQKEFKIPQYLVVEKIKNGEIFGGLIIPTGINKKSISEFVEETEGDIFLANWEKI